MNSQNRKKKSNADRLRVALHEYKEKPVTISLPQHLHVQKVMQENILLEIRNLNNRPNRKTQTHSGFQTNQNFCIYVDVNAEEE